MKFLVLLLCSISGFQALAQSEVRVTDPRENLKVGVQMGASFGPIADGMNLGVSVQKSRAIGQAGTFMVVTGLTADFLNSDAGKGNTTQAYKDETDGKNAPTSGTILIPNLGLSISDVIGAGVFGGYAFLSNDGLARKFQAKVWGPYVTIRISDVVSTFSRFDVPNDMLTVGIRVR